MKLFALLLAGVLVTGGCEQPSPEESARNYAEAQAAYAAQAISRYQHSLQSCVRNGEMHSLEAFQWQDRVWKLRDLLLDARRSLLTKRSFSSTEAVREADVVQRAFDEFDRDFRQTLCAKYFYEVN